jgi:predicted MFS family arabinose efflux permease
MVATGAMLAHQGGWDEIMLVGGPMVIIAGLLVLAKRRVDATTADQSSDDHSSD